MDWSHPERADRLAAEYVLGTLHGRARRRFVVLQTAHPVLREAVARWQARLVPLALAELQGRRAWVEPSPRVWQRIEATLFGSPAPAPALAPAAPARTEPAAERGAERARRPAAEPGRAVEALRGAVDRWWQRLGLWQGLAAAASVAALSFATLWLQPQPASPPIVVVLAPNAAASGVLQASFVASVSADGRSLVLRPVQPLALEAGRALELWAVPADGAPRSLGLVSAERGATLVRAGLLQGVAAFAVSLEPAGGSPTGAPTGPILSVGKLSI